MEGCNPTRTNPNQQEKKMSNETVSGSSLRDNVEELRALLIHTEELQLQVAGAANALGNALLNGGKLLACGNGGSAADASHLTTEYVCRFSKDRRPYPAISLTANGEFMTAVCNDYHADEIFARQVWGLAQPGDLLLAFTSSGKSRNVLRALEEAKRNKIKSICFLGRDGGFTKGVATVDLLVPGTSTARIQEGHKLLFHVLCEAADLKLPKK